MTKESFKTAVQIRSDIAEIKIEIDALKGTLEQPRFGFRISGPSDQFVKALPDPLKQQLIKLLETRNAELEEQFQRL